MCTDPAVLKAIAPAQPSLDIAIMQGLCAVITATRSAFFVILLLLLQAASQMPIKNAAYTSTAAAYSATPTLNIGSSSRAALVDRQRLYMLGKRRSQPLPCQPYHAAQTQHARQSCQRRHSA
eukprot:6047417-Pleurochrysis_carterae.AAC.1